MAISHDLRFFGRSSVLAGFTVAALCGLEAERLFRGSAAGHAICHRWVRRYGRAALRLYGMDVALCGALAQGPGFYAATGGEAQGRIFVLNHRSMLDIFVAAAFLEASFLSRHDLAHWPIIGVAARRAGTVFVDRSDKKSGDAAVEAMSKAVQAGRSVVVFPEGTTFAGDEVRRFRFGAFRAAVLAGSEIVPLGLAYADHALAYEEESFVAHLRRVSGVRRTRLALAAGEPLRPPHSDIERLCAQAHDRVQGLVAVARAALTADTGTPVFRVSSNW